jgi:anion-transporting  ArsA/GET3 family ATPase
LLEPRALLVTGKGGVGKSTVAAALAVAAIRTGRRTCLVEVEGRQAMRSLFNTEPWDFTEREIRPDLFGMSVDPEASLSEYLAMFYGGRRLSKLVVHSSAVDFATTAAPGLKDVLLIGKVKELERRRDPDGAFVYDLVIVDAPPTGRILRFLRAPEATTELVTVGPIREQARSLIEMLMDPARLRIQLVTLLEEMPISETVDSARALHELGVTLNPIVTNRVLQPQFDARAAKAIDGLSTAALQPLAARIGLDADDSAATLLALAQRHLRRLALQDDMRATLDERLRVPALELPYLPTRAFGEAEVGRLADVIHGAQP